MLILSGDHIYKMNYGLMLEQHNDSGADVTLATIQIDPGECPVRRGGRGPRHRVKGFEEKPKTDRNCARRPIRKKSAPRWASICSTPMC